MKRSPLPKSRKPMKRSRLKPANPKRRKSEFARCYHSRERVAFVKNLGCVYCTALSPFFGLASRKFPIHNAHTENEGRGRKGHYTTIIPLCTSHHRCYDEYRTPFDRANQPIRDAMKSAAAEVERRWQSHISNNQESP